MLIKTKNVTSRRFAETTRSVPTNGHGSAGRAEASEKKTIFLVLS